MSFLLLHSKSLQFIQPNNELMQGTLKVQWKCVQLQLNMFSASFSSLETVDSYKCDQLIGLHSQSDLGFLFCFAFFFCSGLNTVFPCTLIPDLKFIFGLVHLKWVCVKTVGPNKCINGKIASQCSSQYAYLRNMYISISTPTLWAAPLCWASFLVALQVPVEDNSASLTWPSRAQLTMWVSPVYGMNFDCGNQFNMFSVLLESNQTKIQVLY